MKNKNRLILGIDQNTDIVALLDFGIRQFYFGYLPQKFIEQFSSKLSLNRRNNHKEQFLDIDILYNTIDTIHQYDAIVYLTLNHMTHNQTMLEYSKEVYHLLKDKVDGIVVSNIAVATFLKNQGYTKIVTSNLFGTYSKQSVAFLIKAFQPIKIILPRDMRLEDIKEIVTTFQDTPFECFLFGDGCRFSESFCYIDQGDYDLSTKTFCSYTIDTNKLVQKAIPSFKMIVKDALLSDEEKREKLQIHPLDIENLLDELTVKLDKFHSKDILTTLNLLSKLDLEQYYKSHVIYLRAKNLLKDLGFPIAKGIYQKLQAKNFLSWQEESNRYKEYHRLDKKSIYETIKFFEKYPNIVSFKIPSRGRNVINLLQLLQFEEGKQASYNYRQSMYKL